MNVLQLSLMFIFHLASSSSSRCQLGSKWNDDANPSKSTPHSRFEDVSRKKRLY